MKVLLKAGFCLILFTCWHNTIAQVARKYSNEFLSIGVGARALGMSNSIVGSVSDVTAGYWNPAGLTAIEPDMQVGLMHAEYFAGIAKYDYGALAKKIDSNSVFAISIIRFGVDNIPNTTELIDAAGNVNYDRITKFSAADYAFIASYARKLKITGLSVGGNFKIIHRKVGDFANSWGFGLDASVRYNYKGWNLGLMARDITTTFNAWSYNLTNKMIEVFEQTGNEIPENSIELTLPKFLMGAGRLFNLKNKFTLFTEINFDLTTDGKRNTLIKSKPFSIDPHLGIEAGYANMVFIRAGIGNIQQELDVTGKKTTTFQPNIGIGLRIKRFVIDYALTDIGDQSAALYSNVFSLRFDIYKSGSSAK
jgi:hypothetical protein